MAEKGQRTEKPTPKRVEKARKEGQFPAAREMVGALQFLAVASMLAAWGGEWLAGMGQTMRWLLGRAFVADVIVGDLVRLSMDVTRRSLVPLAAAGGVVLP